ncbi:6974_t:CDS:2 [Entrophospora sp. SA101]|nr:6974_t:CDS:2 [Entrophospora sp. SA101]
MLPNLIKDTQGCKVAAKFLKSSLVQVFKSVIESKSFALTILPYSSKDIPERDKALSLVMLLLDRFGGRWLFSPNIDEDFSHKKLSKYPKEKVNEDFKFAALVIQLALCYTILEKSIEYFSQFENYLNSQDDNVEVAIKFDPEILLKIKGILTETFRAIIDNLLEFKEYTKNDVKAAINDFKILASIRVLSSWLAEENEFQKEVSLLMPFLINICSYSEKENLELNLVKIMMPAYLNLTSQEEPQDAFLSHDFVNDVLGPIQVLLNIIVSEREKFVIRNEKEISKVMKICFQILNLLDKSINSSSLSSYSSSSLCNNNQIILFSNILLFCLLIIRNTPPSSDQLIENINLIENLKNIANNFYGNIQNNNSLINDLQIEELIYLGKQNLENF